MHSIRCSRVYFVLVISISLIIYNEWLVFSLKSSTWPNLKDPMSSIDILLVADPQILSSQSEPFYPFSLFAIWDANRFVSKSFQFALEHTQADLIIFLGDLINDGSISNKGNFNYLASTFKELLPIPNTAQVFYVPGDNDIGGEGDDIVSIKKIQRFHSAFNSTNPTHHRFLQMFHINALHELQNIVDTKLHPNPKGYSMIASHLPIMPASRPSIVAKLHELQPSLIFTAHDHDSWYFIGSKKSPKAEQFILLRDQGEVLELDLNSDQLYEISVPTCSYRMGKQSYGYGYANVKSNGIVHYSVLWLPSRFVSLISYLLGLCVCLSLCVWPCFRYIFLSQSFSYLPVHFGEPKKSHSV